MPSSRRGAPSGAAIREHPISALESEKTPALDVPPFLRGTGGGRVRDVTDSKHADRERHRRRNPVPAGAFRQRNPSGRSVTPTGAKTARTITLNHASVRIFRGGGPPSDPRTDRTGRPTRAFERGTGQASPSSPLIRPRRTAHGMLRRAQSIIAHRPASRGKRRALPPKARSDRIRRWRRCRHKPAAVSGDRAGWWPKDLRPGDYGAPRRLEYRIA